jgi:predicted nucleic acid-binding protein
MQILIDTNVLTRCIEPGHPHHLTALQAIDRLRTRGDQLCIVPQVLCEHFVVCTRPQQEYGGLGLSNADALNEIARVTRLFQLVSDSPAIFSAWLQLIRQPSVIGKRAHDARIAAAMIIANIPAILTFNLRDFRRYDAIQSLDPAQVVRI